MLKVIADVCGAGAAMWALLALLAAVAGMDPDALSAVTTPEGLAGLVGIAAATLLAGFMARHLVLALLVWALRGRVALDWCWPSECTSFEAWCAFSWDFFGKGGRHMGVRCFGLGVALAGDHGNVHEPAST